MVGMTRKNIVTLLIVQSLTLSLPAWAIGLTASHFLTRKIVSEIEAGSDIFAPENKGLTSTSIIIATLLGIAAPMVAAVAPIRVALGKNLQDSLDPHRSKTKAVVFSIERAEDAKPDPTWLTVGFGLSIFGFLIYYLIPLALLSNNLTLFGNIFFVLLLGMLVGFVLLALNLEHLVERMVVWSCFWWDNRAIPAVVLKNLTAHRPRNRKTTLMFSLSLAFVIFINVAYRVEQQTGLSVALKENGQRITVSTDFNVASIVDVEQVFAEHSDVVADFAWLTADIRKSYSQSQLSSMGHVFYKNVRVRAVTPNFFDVALESYLTPADMDVTSGLSLSEQLYTARGSQTTLNPSSLREPLALDGEPLSSAATLLKLRTPPGLLAGEQPERLLVQKLKPLAWLDSAAGVLMSTFSQLDFDRPQDVLVSLPTYTRLTGKPSADLPFERVLVQLTEAALLEGARERLDHLTTALAQHGRVFDYRDSVTALKQTDEVINLIFSVSTYIAMGLCLFSLVASMYTNIAEQSKEIAILRAVGLNGWAIIRVYVYESFTVTVCAAFMGTVVGTGACFPLFSLMPLVLKSSNIYAHTFTHTHTHPHTYSHTHTHTHTHSHTHTRTHSPRQHHDRAAGALHAGPYPLPTPQLSLLDF
jgi:hypothetical protein